MAKRRRVARRGRVHIAIGLVAFLLVAVGVIWRRSIGVAKATELHLLDRKQAELQSERSKLVSDIRSGTTVGRLAPVVAKRLGMRVPSDSQLIRLPKPAPRRGL